jgi:hypothetical protein
MAESERRGEGAEWKLGSSARGREISGAVELARWEWDRRPASFSFVFLVFSLFVGFVCQDDTPRNAIIIAGYPQRAAKVHITRGLICQFAIHIMHRNAR